MSDHLSEVSEQGELLVEAGGHLVGPEARHGVPLPELHEPGGLRQGGPGVEVRWSSGTGSDVLIIMEIICMSNKNHHVGIEVREAPQKKSALIGDIVRNCPDPRLPPTFCKRGCHCAL